MDPDIFTLASDCCQSFATLSKDLLVRPSVLMPRESVENESGRFRVWCGNLGALQQSFASLDYRLRESPVILSSVCGLLQQLRSNLAESVSVVSGSRPAFEDQTQPDDLSDESTDDSEDDDGNSTRQRHELSMRLSSMTDLLKKLYELGFKIRDPRLRPPSSKAKSYREIDPDTGVDLFDVFPQFDLQHVDALLELLRSGRETPAVAGEDRDYLAPRLAASITVRRKHFRYWEKHGKKLSLQSVPHIKPVKANENSKSVSQGQRGEMPQLSRPPGTNEPKTLMSMTEATKYQDNLDDMTEKGTVVSYASTALDADGHRLELPNAPPEALKGKDFVCPYCSVICPARYGQRKAWRSHVLHDLQPYVCTYQDCPEPSQLYRSRRQWVDHESSRHRRLYRCYEHPELLYKTPDRLKLHMQRDHASRLTDEQMDSLVELSGVSVSDERAHCPICFESAPFTKGLENHLAHHLERFAMFALPRLVEDGASTTDRPDSQRMGEGSLNSRLSLSPPVFSDHGAPNSAISNDDDSSSRVHSILPTGDGGETHQKPVYDMLERRRQIFDRWKTSRQQNKHFNALECMVNAASEHRADRQWERATLLLLLAIRKQSASLGVDHSTTLATIVELANTYGSRGRWTESGNLWARLVGIGKTKLGNKHADTLEYMGKLALAYTNQSRWEEAESLLNETLDLQAEAQGEEHPKRLLNLASLADLCRRQDRLMDVKLLILKIETLCSEAMVYYDAEDLENVRELALWFRGQGRLRNATRMLVGLLEAQRSLLGERHPDTLYTMATLATLWHEQGLHDKAVDLMREYIQIRTEIDSLDDSFIGPDRSLLAQWERELESMGEAKGPEH